MVVERFPLHRMTEKGRAERVQELHESSHPYLARIQRAEKFGEHVMSLELMRRYLVATQQFNVISTWAAMVNTPVPHSFDAGYHLDICRIPQCAGYTAHEEEIRATGSCSVGNLFICCG